VTTATRAKRTTKPAPPEAFMDALEQFFGAVRRAKARAARDAATSDLSDSQFQLLRILLDQAELPVGELACAAGVAGPTATRMFDGLERAGIVERRHSTQDRRVVTVRLTATGRKLVTKKHQVSLKKRQALYDSLTPAERKQVEQLLPRLADAIEDL
jgi:MarR family transcriptional regulator, organic hydroperoxide resistance regulator